MTVQELLALAEQKRHPSRHDARPDLTGYCDRIAKSLVRAMTEKDRGIPAKYRLPKGPVDTEVSDEDLLQEGAPLGWGAHIVEAMIDLACLCKRYQIRLDASLEQKLRPVIREEGDGQI